MIINAAECGRCKEVIYSRHTDDTRYCKCGLVAIRGGHRFAIVIDSGSDLMISHTKHRIEVDTTEQELAHDWRTRENKFGLYK